MSQVNQSTALPANPHKLRRDVRLRIEMPQGVMFTSPMTFYDLAITHRAFLAMGVPPENIQPITDQRSLRAIDKQQEQAGNVQQYGLATFEAPDGSKYAKMAFGPPGQEISPENMKALLGVNEPASSKPCSNPSQSAPSEEPGAHPCCGELPTDHYEQPTSLEISCDVAGIDSPQSKEASAYQLQKRHCEALAEPISTLGLVVLGWTCWRMVAWRFVRACWRELVAVARFQ